MKRQTKYSSKICYMLLTAIAVAAPSKPLLADDTDVFFAINEETYIENKPNIMFIVDKASSMSASGAFTFDQTECEVDQDDPKMQVTKNCYDINYKVKKPCYDNEAWYYLPNDDLSRVNDNKGCWKDPANKYMIRLDRPIMPHLDANRDALKTAPPQGKAAIACSGLADDIKTKGGRSGHFAALYKRRCTTWGPDGDGQECSIVWGSNEYGWYPVDQEIRDTSYTINAFAGLSNSKKIVALECLSDVGEDGFDDPNKKYPISDNSALINDTQNPLPDGWSDNKADFVKKPFEFGGIYSGHYLNYLRETTTTKDRPRKDMFTSALKRFVERSKNIRLGLASQKFFSAASTCLNGSRGERMAAGRNGTNAGCGDGGSIDVPVVDIDTMHEKFRWLPSHEVTTGIFCNLRPPWSCLNGGTNRSTWNRDMTHREWLWAQIDNYYSGRGHPEGQFETISKHIPGVGNRYIRGLAMNEGREPLWGVDYRPLGEMLFEVGRYYRGEKPKFGGYSRPEAWTDISEWGGKLADSNRKVRANYRKGSAGEWGPVYSYPKWDDKWGWGDDDQIHYGTYIGNKHTYVSPVQPRVSAETGESNADPCEANIVVMFTDYTGDERGLSPATGSTGLSFLAEAGQDKIDGKLLPPFDDNDEAALMQRLWPGLDCAEDITKYGTCLPSIAGYLANNDVSNNVKGKQAVRTFIVSYWADNSFRGEEPPGVAMLRETAKRGKGKFVRFGASLAELDAAISKIMSISALNPIGAGTFVAPAASVDLSNRLEHNKDVYFSLFEPSETDAWKGNVKRYKIDYVNKVPQIVNVDCNSTDCPPAVNEDNFFTATATSGWTNESGNEPDGNNVTQAGAVAKLPQPSNSNVVDTEPRKIFTDYCALGSGNNLQLADESCFRVGDLDPSDSSDAAELEALASKFNLNQVPVTVDKDKNGNYTHNKNYELFKFYVQQKISYLQGYAGENNAANSNTIADRKPRIGDPLHSQPKLMNYADKTVIYFGTNEGYVHAINSADGNELFAFAPESAFGAVSKYHDNEVSEPGKKVYGVDGEIETWINDTNGDGRLNNQEKGYIFFGMRRGGNHYYGMDVTNTDVPKLAWNISRTPYNNKNKLAKNGNSYHELGQTWAKPILIKAKPKLPKVLDKNGNKDSDLSDKKPSKPQQGSKPKAMPRERAILVLTAGYDGGQDRESSRKRDNYGRAIYLVDAESGKRLWAAGFYDANNTNVDSLQNQSAYNAVEAADTKQKKVLGNMQYSFAATPAVYDIDGDGYIDTIVAVDTGGQVWRVNLEPKVVEKNAKGEFAGYKQVEPTIELVARLASDGGTQDRPNANNRKFFNTPDLMFDRTDRSLVVAIGSGRRPEPLDQSVDNRMYVLRLKVNAEYVENPPTVTIGTATKFAAGYKKIITEADLYDATANNSFADSDKRSKFFENGFLVKMGQTYINGATEASCLRNKANKFISISDRVDCKNAGEKIIGNASIFNNTVIFTSYLPSRVPEFCGAALGDNRFNAISLQNPDTRISVRLEQHGIAPKPAVMLIKDAKGERKPAIVVGTEVVKPGELGKMEGLKSLYTLSRDKLIKMWLER